MSRTPTFARVQSDARRIAQAHRTHTDAAYFGCPLCVITTRRDTLPRWSSPRRA